MGCDKLLLFDLDDTIVPNIMFYDLAKIEVMKFLLRKLSWKAPVATEYYAFAEALDVSKVATMGYNPERFISTEEEAAAHFFRIAGAPYRKSDRRRVRALASLAFSPAAYRRADAIPGAKDVVRYVRNEGAAVRLVTKGDRGIQRKKIEVFGIDDVFKDDEIHILDEKNAETLGQIVGGADKQHAWKIGNMIKSDVIPALELGIGAVYIPRETWLHETQNVPKLPADARVFTLQVITQLPGIYRQL